MAVSFAEGGSMVYCCCRCVNVHIDLDAHSTLAVRSQS